MSDFLARVAINAVAIIVVLKVMPEIQFDDGGDWWKLLLVAGVFAVINSVIRPIVKLISLPLNVVTLGLAGLVVNMLMFLLLALVVDGMVDVSFTIAGWPVESFSLDTIIYGFLAALLISIVSAALGMARRIIPG